MSRRRYRYDKESKQVVEIDSDWTDVERRAPVATEGIVYGSLGTSTDGTPIDTRKRHREYMKQNGLALTGDYTQTWEKAQARRDDFFATGGSDPSRRQDVARAVERVFNGRKRR